MDRLDRSLTRVRRLRQLHIVFVIVRAAMMLYMMWYTMNISIMRSIELHEGKRSRKRLRLVILKRLTRESDVFCLNELRMNRNVFNVLCEMLRGIGGLTGTKNMSVEEIVAIFLYTLAHHKKNRTIAHYFIRSGESVSRHFNKCLMAVLKCHEHLLKTPTPISDDCQDDRWKCFKNCLGALDGTFISVTAPSGEKAKYRTRKGTISMNVLGVCTPNMEFTYVLVGWEGSAHDGRVLRNSLTRPDGLKVPRGCYYLVDGGYANSEGFLAPYRGQRYHLKEWGNRQPSSAEEYYNMKHARARNVIERVYGVLKGRWAILRSPSYFPIRTQGRIVLACCLLHNLIRKFMPTDQGEEEEWEEESESDYDSDSDSDSDSDEDDNNDGDDEGRTRRGRRNNQVEYITNTEPSDRWTTFRNTLAQRMFNGWRSRNRST